MKLILTLSALLLVSTLQLSAQNRQAFYASNQAENFFIHDSQVDTSGNIIHAGRVFDSGGPGSWNLARPVVIKTDRNGTPIWSRRLSFGVTCVKVRIAANGDYLVLAKDAWPMLWRITPGGTTRFAYRYGYNALYGDNVMGITELPNGHIAICGFNDFTTGSGVHRGYLIRTDSAGLALSSPPPSGGAIQTYASGTGSSNQVQFHDVASLGNKLYFAGIHQPFTGSPQGVIVRTDPDGSNPACYATGPLLNYGSIPAAFRPFHSISAVGGKLYVSTMFWTDTTTEHLVIGRFDTSSLTVSGVELHVPKKLLDNPRNFIRDSSNWFFSFMPTTTFNWTRAERDFFSGRISNGSVAQCRRIYQDSSAFVYSLAIDVDTVIHCGTVRLGTMRPGFMARYNTAAPAASLCNVADTSVQSSPFSIPMSLQSLVTFIPRNLLGPQQFLASPSCVYDVHLCGTPPPCGSAGLAVSMTAISATTVCPGDTLRFVRTGSCHRMTWYKDSLEVWGRDTLVIPTDTGMLAAGKYFVVVDNGTCRDTSAIVSVTVYPGPRIPLISQSGDSLLSSAALRYQWLDSNGNAIPGDTLASIYPPDSAWYSVRVWDSNGCSSTSAPSYYVRPVSTGIVVTSAHYTAIRILPNPARSMFTITSGTSEPVSLSLSDNTGRCMKRWIQTAVSQQYNIVEMGLPPGLYVITASGNGRRAWHKLVVL